MRPFIVPTSSCQQSQTPTALFDNNTAPELLLHELTIELGPLLSSLLKSTDKKDKVQRRVEKFLETAQGVWSVDPFTFPLRSLLFSLWILQHFISPPLLVISAIVA